MTIKKFKKMSVKSAALAIASVLAIGCGVTATYAAFSDTGSNAITAKAGTVSGVAHVSTMPDTALTLFTASGLKPGVTQTYNTTVKNTSNVPASYTLLKENWVEAPEGLETLVNIEAKVGTSRIYIGNLYYLSTLPRTLQPGASETITWTVNWPYKADVSSKYQNTSAYGSIRVIFSSV